jgi:hypothetical protein
MGILLKDDVSRLPVIDEDKKRRADKSDDNDRGDM